MARAAGVLERMDEPAAEGGPTGRSGSGLGMAARLPQEPWVQSGGQWGDRVEISLRPLPEAGLWSASGSGSRRAWPGLGVAAAVWKHSIAKPPTPHRGMPSVP